MKLTPMYDHVVIKLRPATEKSVGGIILSGASENAATIGDITEVGPGVLLESGELCPLPLNVGDSVVLPPHATSQSLSVEGFECVILRAREILAVITPR